MHDEKLLSRENVVQCNSLPFQDPRFIDASLAYCGQNTTCTNRSKSYFQIVCQLLLSIGFAIFFHYLLHVVPQNSLKHPSITTYLVQFLKLCSIGSFSCSCNPGFTGFQGGVGFLKRGGGGVCACIPKLSSPDLAAFFLLFPSVCFQTYPLQVGCHDLDECSYYSNSGQYCGSNNAGCINIGNSNQQLIFLKRRKSIRFVPLT